WLIDWRALVSLKYTFCDVVQSWTCLLCATCPTAYTLSHLNNIIIVTLYSHKRHTATHTWIYGGDTGRPEVVCEFSHPGLSFPQDHRSSGQLLSARGPSEVNCLSWSGTDKECSVLFCMFFCWGYLVAETPCEHGENMQTPHRKAREIAHLSTEAPRAN